MAEFILALDGYKASIGVEDKKGMSWNEVLDLDDSCKRSSRKV